MLFNVRQVPPPPLSRFIENFWLVKGALDSRWRNAIFPDGAMELILNLGDPQKLCDPSDWNRPTFFKQSWIAGERSEPIVIEEFGAIHLIGIRFKPGGAYPFLQFPISELTGRVVEMDAVWGREIDRLREQLAEAPTPKAVFARLEAWLRQRLAGRPAPSPSVTFALDQIQRGEGTRIGQIVDEIGISHKQLTRDFDRCVGITPKLLARVCAFQTAIKWIGFKPAVDWADAAAVCGYYDQAHFIREFRAFTGLTPAAYLSRRGPFLNYVTVDPA